MKFKRNLLILSVILIGILIVVIGCQPAPTTPPAEEGDVPSGGTISIAGGAVTTNDTTPPLTISATDADYMAFSGNGTTWSSWVTYATAYSTFNITTGAGCTSGDGTKIVYVKFKNDTGESTKVYDSIVLDTVAPTLSTAVYSDANSSSTVNKGDTITFTFNDEMLTSTVTSTNVATSLLLSAGNYGTGPTVSWSTTGTICTVTLGTSPTIVYGTTVNPASSVKDTAGNADASSAVTISGTTTTVLYSVTISPSSARATVGTAMSQSFTASALSTVGTTMTSSCTFTWSISPATGRGSLSSTSGTTVTYTLPATGVTAGTATITVTAIKIGTTTPIQTAYAYVTVSAVAADTTAPTAALTYTIGVSPVTHVKEGDSVIITAIFSEPLADTPVVKLARTVTNPLVAAVMTKVNTTFYTQLWTVGTGNGTMTAVMSVGTDVAGNLVTAAPTSGATAIVDNTAPTATLPGVPSGLTNNATTIVATFSEDLYIAGTAVANGADVKTSFTETGCIITTAIYNVAAKTITFTVANATNTNTIQHNADATKLTDAAGNAYLDKTYTYTEAGTLWITD